MVVINNKNTNKPSDTEQSRIFSTLDDIYQHCGRCMTDFEKSLNPIKTFDKGDNSVATPLQSGDNRYNNRTI